MSHSNYLSACGFSAIPSPPVRKVSPATQLCYHCRFATGKPFISICSALDAFPNCGSCSLSWREQGVWVEQLFTTLTPFLVLAKC